MVVKPEEVEKHIFYPEISKKAQNEFIENGFCHFESVLSKDLVGTLCSRFEPMFSGEFDTGIYPDEWHWRKGISNPNAFREIVNSWKSDYTINQLVLSEKLGKITATLCNWPGARIAQDDLLWKPAGTKGVGMHRDSTYISEQFFPLENNSLTIWVALDDADSTSGVVQYLKGSHKWSKAKENNIDHDQFFKGSIPIGADKHLTSLKVKAGDIICHHQDILHGSSDNVTKNRPRRAIGVHLLRNDVRWAENKPITYIYGRYKLKNEAFPRDDFFPVTFSNSNRAKL